MQCERLIKLVKTWYIHVKDETMAPARMVQFIKQHVEECPICLDDRDIQDEIERITEIVLPESKIPKAVRMKQEMEEARLAEEEANGDEENSDSEQETETQEDYADEEEVEEEPLSPDK
jgi:hypothetical protein